MRQSNTSGFALQWNIGFRYNGGETAESTTVLAPLLEVGKMQVEITFTARDKNV